MVGWVNGLVELGMVLLGGLMVGLVGGLGMVWFG